MTGKLRQVCHCLVKKEPGNPYGVVLSLGWVGLICEETQDETYLMAAVLGLGKSLSAISVAKRQEGEVFTCESHSSWCWNGTSNHI